MNITYTQNGDYLKPKKIAFYESTQFAGLINMIDLGRAFSILLSGDR